ncbi:hypothetical protein LINPERPRIM_LOCUS33525 [Linum perenne]
MGDPQRNHPLPLLRRPQTDENPSRRHAARGSDGSLRNPEHRPLRIHRLEEVHQRRPVQFVPYSIRFGNLASVQGSVHPVVFISPRESIFNLRPRRAHKP